EVADVMARSAARLLDGNDLFDLAEREAKPSSLRDEPDDRERVISIHTVARGGAPRRRENARRLVQAQRLAADATPGGDLTDEQTVSCHDPELTESRVIQCRSRASRIVRWRHAHSCGPTTGFPRVGSSSEAGRAVVRDGSRDTGRDCAAPRSQPPERDAVVSGVAQWRSRGAARRWPSGA